ncbi:hypothetical protein [Paenibacillus odorifer]|uniref:hypothetical protein n=1 Tax=Paenibacillus TaxID=44249 RepID=UPI00097002D9|nr:hypothetical protein [Paenibacillus odorifer]OMD11305.1 hypothetical protein BJP47_27110 [Paenibacillus odorifer]OME28074.1 hypothetical protein BSK63_24640 [Paenibacillus odorifer]OME30946.1 hypothetical protein BSK46_26295 [Paenibacillus odorifer]OME55090.1 hypothetical protein BSK61_13555 [Paenibacillus odorifer]
MSIQFLDMRISQGSTMDAQNLNLVRSGAIFGDIGLQTVKVTPANAGLVRVTLNAFARLSVDVSIIVQNDVTFSIYRNNILIFSTTYPGNINNTTTQYEMVGITAVDYPPSTDLLTGQIQYTIVASAIRTASLGARSFSGIAVAGNG